MRKIIHVDMDAFYAAVEQRDDPGLRGLPIAVGGAGGRSVVMTASYEARPFGVRSAMPGSHARRLCPDLVFVSPRFNAYREASRAIRAIFARWTELVEPLSLDEAYLDVTAPLLPAASAGAIARAIKAAIVAETGLTASAGVSINKFLAKTASDIRKPDGLTVITAERALGFLARLPIERFHGVGPATAIRMHALGIRTGADLQDRSPAWLAAAFGSMGQHYWRMANALDDRPVTSDRPRLSLGVEQTFSTDLAGRDALAAALLPLTAELASRVVLGGFMARTLTLKIRLADFTLVTRRLTSARALDDAERLHELALALLDRPAPPDARVRLLGVTVSRSQHEVDRRQLDLGLAVQHDDHGNEQD